MEVTSERPVYIKIHQARDSLSTDDDEGEWEEVRDLEVGDEIRLVSGSRAKILDIRFKGEGEVCNEPQKLDRRLRWKMMLKLLPKN